MAIMQQCQGIFFSKLHLVKKTISMFLFIVFPVLSATNTIIVGDNTPGPYYLGSGYLDSASLNVAYKDTMRGIIPPYMYVSSQNALFFSQSIDSGTVIAVNYKIAFFGLDKHYSLYSRRFLSLTDSSFSGAPKLAPSFFMKNSDNLTVSGYKSIGISLGSQGQMNLSQALEVRIFGTISEHTTLLANLSDQGTSLEGDTRELGELDKMFVTLKHPKYRITIGDQYARMLYSGIFSDSKKIKGLSAAYTGEHFQLSACGAISGGKFTVQTIAGRLGFQGPYFLTGSDEADIISPIAGTIIVKVDGKQLRVGELFDYTVDYDIGAIRFTPNFGITNDMIIQFSYEYKAFDYQRTFLNNNTSIISQDSIFIVNGALWFETDNKNHPIEQIFDDKSLISLKKSGDSIPTIEDGRLVDPLDAESQNALYRLYRKDTTDTDFFYFDPFDYSKPSQVTGYYLLWFNNVMAFTGDYICYLPDSSHHIVAQSMLDSIVSHQLDSIAQRDVFNSAYKSDPRGPIYLYVGSNRGNYSIQTSMTSPKRQITGEVTMNFKPTEWLNVSTDIAGIEEDKNLFSSKDDNDNVGGASKTSLFLGKKNYDDRSIYLLTNHLYSGKRFDRELMSAYQRKILWDRECLTDNSGIINAWMASGGATIIPQKIGIKLSYGQFYLNETFITQRFNTTININPTSLFKIDFSSLFIDHRDASSANLFQRDSLRVTIYVKPFTAVLGGYDEWLTRNNGVNVGNIGVSLNLRMNSFPLSEEFSFKQYRKGSLLSFTPWESTSIDTGYALCWRQKFSHSPSPIWKFGGKSSYFRQKICDVTESILLINAFNDIAVSDRGFATRQEYRLTSEQASSFVEVPYYTGQGFGGQTYNSYEETWENGENGNYYVADQEVYHKDDLSRIRKSRFKLDYTMRPKKDRVTGILADLRLQGSLFLEEHINVSMISSAPSWLPGYISINSDVDSAITYADLSYKQSINWYPSFAKPFNMALTIKPFFKNLSRYTIAGMELELAILRNAEKLHLSLTGDIYRADKFNLSLGDTANLSDSYVWALQRIFFVKQLSLFLKEHVGIAKRCINIDTTTGPYFRFQPGITLRIPEKGLAEVSYTWSFVDIDGYLDYPLAQGFTSGISHIIDFVIDIRIKDHFSIGGSYRGSYRQNIDVKKKWQHFVTMEVKAFL